MKIVQTIAIVLYLLMSFVLTSWASIDPQQLKLGDEAFRERRTESRARQSLEIYRSIYQANPNDPEVGWRLSMACYFIGIRDTPRRDDRIKIYAEGRDIGRKAVKNSENCAPCHFWTAINMALYGQEVGVFKTLTTLNDIKEHLKKSVEINPAYAYGGAYRLLAMIEDKLPGFFGGSDARAKQYFLKAIQLAPDEPMNYLFYARFLKTSLKDMREARLVAQDGVKIQLPKNSDRVESVDALRDLKQFLSSLDGV